MKTRPSEKPQRKPRKRWRWHVPPAILHGPETLEGTEMLDEVTGETGVLLWQSLRDVTLWSGAAPENRAGLFSPGAGEARRKMLQSAKADPEIRAPLDMLAELVENSGGIAAETVTTACREISQWAEGRGSLAAAVAFAQAGALASPANPTAGLRVAKLARKKGENARAETWFRRTVGLARQAKDWESYSRAFLGLGNLYRLRGVLPTARHLYIRGLRAAKRHSMRTLQGDALHELFTIAEEMGQPREAESLARSAYEAYGPEHPLIPALAHDVAYFWTSLGHYGPALSVFQALLPEARKPLDRMCIAGSLARAAGGAGEGEAFTEARREVERLLTDPGAGEIAARALLDLARGAASLDDWDTAEKAVDRAREIATEREEARVIELADSLMEAVKSERAVEEKTGGEKVDVEEAEALAADFIRSIREYSAAG